MSVGCQKISAKTWLNIWPPNSPDCNPLDYCVGCGWPRDQQNSVLHQRWTEDKDNGSILQFKEGDRRKSLQKTPKSSGGCGWSWQRFLWINFICSIPRYFHAIFVNISDKLSYQCYFHFCVIQTTIYPSHWESMIKLK